MIEDEGPEIRALSVCGRRPDRLRPSYSFASSAACGGRVQRGDLRDDRHVGFDWQLRIFPEAHLAWRRDNRSNRGNILIA